MSPFTGDSHILNKILHNDSFIWKELHGAIQSIRIFDRKEASPKNSSTVFTVEIKTDESVVSPSNPQASKACTGIYKIEAKWDFMVLQSVNIKKLKLECI